MRLKPLKQWICDSCNEVIEKPEDSWFEWYVDNNDSLEKGFRIVHHKKECMYDGRILRRENKMTADMPLPSSLGSDGLSGLLFRIELSEKGIYKIADLKEFVEIMRRLYIPYWEEARHYWHRALNDGFHDGCQFSAESLQDIIREYEHQELE